MNKGIIIKASIILGFFGIVLGLAFGCSSIKDKNITPEISNREDVYLTVGDIEVTRQDLWEMMKITDGLSYLIQYSEEILLAQAIAGITEQEVDDEITLLTYGTLDEDLIAEIKEDPELEADYIESFESNLIILGFDPESDDDLRAFVELSIAKNKITKEYILNATEGDSLEITDTAIETYYERNTKGDICVIDVRFSSVAEANDVFDKFNLVPNYNLGFGKYFDEETPIEDRAVSEFDATNTTQLSDEEVFEEFINLYNYMNPSLDQIPTNTDFEDYCADYSDVGALNYEEATKNRVQGDPYLTYTSYLFDTLSLEEDAVRYSYTLQTAASFSVLAFKVSEEEVTAFEDLTQAELDAIVLDMVEELITDTSISIAMDTYWEDQEFEIYDPMLKLQYQFNNGVEYDNKGHETLVAKIGDTEITADQLFTYMEESLGTYYTIEIVKALSLLDSVYYTAIYGESHDFLNSDNETMIEHRGELREMKGIFSSNGYAAYGFDSSVYSWDEFLILAFGSVSEADVIRDLFIIGNLQPNLIGDSIEYEHAADYIQKVVDEYFSLNAEHILLYVDFDKDFTPDEFNDIVDELSGADLVEYQALVVAFEDLIKDKVSTDEYSFIEVVTEYNDSLVDDPENVWAEFKAYGFYIMTESLSTSESLTSLSTTNFDEDFVTALKRIYDSYVVAVENSIEDIDEFYDDRLIQSNFGLHFILATEGTGFEQPTAVYDNSTGDYSDGSGGTTVVPSESQIDLYIEIKYAEMIGEVSDLIMPTSVYTAIEAYYSPIYQAYFSTSGYSIASTNYILDNNPVFATLNADRISYLQDVLEVLYNVNFPEEFNIPE